MTKIEMFSNGRIVAIDEKGQVRNASKVEASKYLASKLPQEYEGETLQKVKFNPKDGCVYGKYATKGVKKRLYAATNEQTEPVNSGDKANPDLKVPKNKSKSKPESETVVKDRPDVANPTKIREEKYQRGKGGEDLHTKEVPRSKSNSGLAGSDKTEFADEVADKATSGNPDNYVQKLVENKKPEKAGSEKNHVASLDIEIANEQEMYQPIKLAMEDEKMDEKKKDSEKEDNEDDNEKNIDTSKSKKDKLPPWLKKDKKEDEEDESEKKDKEKEASRISGELLEKNKEIESLKIKQSRLIESAKYALALLKFNPEKYTDEEAFISIMTSTAEKMNVDSIKVAKDEMESRRAEFDDRMLQIKQASLSEDFVNSEEFKSDGVSMPFMFQENNRVKLASSENDDLKSILQAETILGRKNTEYEQYIPGKN